MPLINEPLVLGTHIEFTACREPAVAPTGKTRLWWDQSASLLKVSVSGGAYAELTSFLAGSWSAADMLSVLASSSILNSHLATPKLTAYQQTVAFGSFTDGGSTAGTLDLSTTIPAGAVFARSLVTGITGFTGDTSAVLTIGDGSDVDRYNTGTPSLFTTAAAGVDLGVPSGTLWHTAAATPKLTVTSGSDWGLVVAGAATITLFYYAP